MVNEQWRCERGLSKHPFVRVHGIVRLTLCANRLPRIVAAQADACGDNERCLEEYLC